MMPSVHEYVIDYEFRFDGGAGYTPTLAERAMIEDAIQGYLGANPVPSVQVTAARGRGDDHRPDGPGPKETRVEKRT